MTCRGCIWNARIMGSEWCCCGTRRPLLAVKKCPAVKAECEHLDLTDLITKARRYVEVD